MDLDKLKQSSVDMFFNKIIKNASNKESIVYEFTYNIGFNTNLKDNKSLTINKDSSMPFLCINNRSEFENILKDIVEEIYNNDIMYTNTKNSIIKERIFAFFTLVWANATYEDFCNPISFLKRYLNFIKDETFSEFNNESKLCELENFDGFSLFVKRREASIFLETPYCLDFSLKKGDVVYNFPRIMYGISDNVCYIYAIQNDKSNEENKDIKKLKRLFYKLNSNVVDENDESIKDITISNLFVLTSMFSLLKDKNITKIYAPDFLPVRYNAKEEAIKKKAKYLLNKKPFEEVEEFLSESNKEFLRIQNNITNKFLRTFLRLEYHFSNIDVVNLPENSSFLISEINDDYNCNNQILDEVFSKINNSKFKK